MTAKGIEKGPMYGRVVERLEEIWKSVEADASAYNFETYTKLLKAGLL